MAKSFTGRKRIRKISGAFPRSPMPNLIEVQKSSYDQFSAEGHSQAEDRTDDSGLQEVFKSVFPIGTFPSVPARVREATSSKSRSTTSRSASSAA